MKTDPPTVTRCGRLPSLTYREGNGDLPTSTQPDPLRIGPQHVPGLGRKRRGPCHVPISEVRCAGIAPLFLHFRTKPHGGKPTSTASFPAFEGPAAQHPPASGPHHCRGRHLCRRDRPLRVGRRFHCWKGGRGEVKGGEAGWLGGSMNQNQPTFGSIPMELENCTQRQTQTWIFQHTCTVQQFCHFISETSQGWHTNLHSKK